MKKRIGALLFGIIGVLYMVTGTIFAFLAILYLSFDMNFSGMGIVNIAVACVIVATSYFGSIVYGIIRWIVTGETDSSKLLFATSPSEINFPKVVVINIIATAMFLYIGVAFQV